MATSHIANTGQCKGNEMFKLSSFLRPFKTTTKVPEVSQVIIPIGSTWVLNKAKGDPFPSKEHTPATILDVRDGWVRYTLGSMFKDNRMESPTFLRIYTQITNT